MPPSATETATSALMASDCAVTTAEPTPCAVIKPFASTVATAGADEDHVTGRVSAAPVASFGVAVSCLVSVGTRTTELSDRDIVATGGGATISLQLEMTASTPVAVTTRRDLLRRTSRLSETRGVNAARGPVYDLSSKY